MKKILTWIYERCGYEALHYNHPAWSGALTVCAAAQYRELARRCSRGPLWFFWEAQAEPLLTALAHGDACGFVAEAGSEFSL